MYIIIQLFLAAPKEPTNIGKTLSDAYNRYSPGEKDMVFIASDFINIQEEPAIADSLKTYTDAGVHVSIPS